MGMGWDGTGEEREQDGEPMVKYVLGTCCQAHIIESEPANLNPWKRIIIMIDDGEICLIPAP